MLTPRFRLTKLLGAGGMGMVWAAEDLELVAPVAVKFAASGGYGGLVRETNVTTRIRSAHTVQVLQLASTAEGCPFMVMELLEGETLRTRMQRSTVLTLQQTTKVVRDVCAALGGAHGYGIVHRDVKPENIFVGPGFFVKLLDFGIAKSPEDLLTPELTTAGTLLGTATYASPEQVLDAASVDARADLWSLAVVAYQCLTGHLPYPGNTLAAVCLALRAGCHVPPTKFRPDLPRALDAWFERAFARGIEQRFATVEELSEAWFAALSAPTAQSRLRLSGARRTLSSGARLTPLADLPSYQSSGL